MADGTHIEWADATWNPITGCSVTSPGCKHCYAMLLAGTRLGGHPSRAGLTVDTKAGPVWTGEVRFNEQWLYQPLHWSKPRKIFVCAHGDLFHESVPDKWIDCVFAVIASCPQHIFQVLTKRSHRMRTYLAALPDRVFDEYGGWEGYGDAHLDGIAHQTAAAWPLPNAWIGVSVEDQERATERVPHLLQTPAAVRWLSCESLLGALNLNNIDVHEGDAVMDALQARDWALEIEDWRNSSPHWKADFEDWYGRDPDGVTGPMHPTLDWVVVGGESGPGARPMHPEWVRSLREQCAAAGVPFLFKQWGEWAPVCELAEDQIDACYVSPPESRPLASRRCRVEHLVMQSSGRIFPMDAWGRLSGENPIQRDFAFAAGSGAMTMMRVGKRISGRHLDGVLHDAFPGGAA